MLNDGPVIVSVHAGSEYCIAMNEHGLFRRPSLHMVDKVWTQY
jgi:hypothetical protein